MPDFARDLFQQVSSILVWQMFKYGSDSVTMLSILAGLAFCLLFLFMQRKFRKWAAKRICKTGLERRTKKEALLFSYYLLYPIGLFTALRLVGIDHWLYAQLIALQSGIKSVIDLKLFTIGKTELTLWTLLYLVVLSWLLVRLTSQCEGWFVQQILARTRLESGMKKALAATLRYVCVTVGFVVIIQSAGIDLSALTIVGGGLAVAIGLSLQTLMNNLISGLVVLFERPIRVGDRIDMGGVTGDVSHVSLRATTIITSDDIAIIVPNSEFITSKVINWTYTGRKCRFKFPIKIAPNSNPAQLKRLLLEVVASDPGVLATPAPKVLFEEFADTALSFSLLVWSTDYVTRPAELRSNLNFAISKKLTENGIKIYSAGQDSLSSKAGDATESFHPQRMDAITAPREAAEPKGFRHFT